MIWNIHHPLLSLRRSSPVGSANEDPCRPSHHPATRRKSRLSIAPSGDGQESGSRSLWRALWPGISEKHCLGCRGPFGHRCTRLCRKSALELYDSGCLVGRHLTELRGCPNLSTDSSTLGWEGGIRQLTEVHVHTIGPPGAVDDEGQKSGNQDSSWPKAVGGQGFLRTCHIQLRRDPSIHASRQHSEQGLRSLAIQN